MNIGFWRNSAEEKNEIYEGTLLAENFLDIYDEYYNSNKN